MAQKRSTEKKRPTPGTWVSKNIEYRGEFQYRVAIRRRGHPEIQKTFETQAAAVDYRDTVLARIKLGVLVDQRKAEDQTFGQLALEYFQAVTPTKKGAADEAYRLRRILGYTKRVEEDGKKEVIVGHCSSPKPGDQVIPPQRITQYALTLCSTTIAQEWIDERKAEGWTSANIDRYRQILSAVFSWGRDEKRLPIVNPFTGLPLAAPRKARRRRISREEEEAMVDALKCLTYAADKKTGLPLLDDHGKPFLRRRPPTFKTRLRSAFFLLTLESACRRGELLRAVWHDEAGNEVNLKDGFIFLEDSKNGLSRTIGLTDKAIEILEEVRALRVANEDGSVFGMTEAAWKSAWHRAVTAARLHYAQECENRGIVPNPRFLADFHFHDSRHEACSQLAKQMDQIHLMKQGGWVDVRSLAIYYEPSGKDMRNKLVGFTRKAEPQRGAKVIALRR